MFFLLCFLLLNRSTLTLRLLYANQKDIRLLRIHGNTSKNESVILPAAEEAVAIDFLYTKSSIFWSDVSEEKIFSCNLSIKCRPKVIMSDNIGRIEGLAVDWLTEKLYWTDSYLKKISVSDTDGNHRKALIWQNIDNPRAINVDPNSGFVFWSDWGEYPRISRAGMDGSNHIAIVKTSITWPNGLTLDYINKIVYWIDARHNHIANVDYHGNNRQVTYSKANNHPYAITMLGKKLYWTDWDSNSIRQCDSSNVTTTVKVILTNIFYPMDIKVYESERQRTGLTNPCKKENGGCSHLCLLSSATNYSCACPSGIALRSDSKSCEDGPQKFLLLTQRDQIRLLSLSTDERNVVQLPIENIGQATAIEFDHFTKLLYWIDSQHNEIKCAPLNGSDVNIIISQGNGSSIEGLAIDRLNKRLYWTDTGTDTIEVSHLDGSIRMVLISRDLDEPRAIAVDHNDGFVYWSDWGTHPKIERVKLNGTGREIIINSSIAWPNGLVIDHKLRRIYWADARLDKIESCDMYGGTRVTITREKVPHIFGFTMIGDHLYWTDIKSRVLEMINKKSGKNRKVLTDFVPNAMALKGVDLRDDF